MPTKDKAAHWRERAAEALAIAEQMTHLETKATMLTIAAGYDRMAEQAEKHEAVLREVAKSSPPKRTRCFPGPTPS